MGNRNGASCCTGSVEEEEGFGASKSDELKATGTGWKTQYDGRLHNWRRLSPQFLDYVFCFPCLTLSTITGVFRYFGCFRYNHTFCDVARSASDKEVGVNGCLKRSYRSFCYILSCCNCFFYSYGCLGCGRGNVYHWCGWCGHRVAGYEEDQS
jgi:hypothetical protein